MNRLKLLLILSFLLVFGAGAVVGMVQGRATAPEPTKHDTDRPRDPGSWMADELGLSSEQRTQMRQIWSQVFDEQMPLLEERERALDDRRDNALLSLLTPEQRAEYDRIQAEVREQFAQIRQERNQIFEQAQARTRALFTPEQQAKYDEWMERGRRQWGERDRDRDRGRGDRRRWDRDRGDRDDRDRRDNNTTRPTTEPTTAPAVEVG